MLSNGMTEKYLKKLTVYQLKKIGDFLSDGVGKFGSKSKTKLINK